MTARYPATTRWPKPSSYTTCLDAIHWLGETPEEEWEEGPAGRLLRELRDSERY